MDFWILLEEFLVRIHKRNSTRESLLDTTLAICMDIHCLH